MPRFSEYQDVEVDIDVDVDDFLNSCNEKEKDELIEALIEDGYLKKDCRLDSPDYNYSVPEAMYVEAIDKLRNKWNSLTKEEEEVILNLAKRF